MQGKVFLKSESDRILVLSLNALNDCKDERLAKYCINNFLLRIIRQVVDNYQLGSICNPLTVSLEQIIDRITLDDLLEYGKQVFTKLDWIEM